MNLNARNMSLRIGTSSHAAVCDFSTVVVLTLVVQHCMVKQQEVFYIAI